MRFIMTLTPVDPGPSVAGEASPPAQKESPEAPFNEALFVAHMEFNEAMHRAGVLVASEGLNPGARGAHVLVSGTRRTVTDGPYAETKELVGGFYLLEVASLQEAIEWAKRYPGSFAGDEVIEIRQLTGAGDLPPHLVELICKAAPTWSRTFTRPG